MSRLTTDQRKREKSFIRQRKNVNHMRRIYPATAPRNRFDRNYIKLLDIFLAVIQLPFVLLSYLIVSLRFSLLAFLRRDERIKKPFEIENSYLRQELHPFKKGMLKTFYCAECNFTPCREPESYVTGNFLLKDVSNSETGLSLCGLCGNSPDVENLEYFVTEDNADTFHYRHPRNHYLWKVNKMSKDPFPWLRQ